MPRQTVLNDLVEKRLTDAIREGHSYAAACRAAGIGESTFHEWYNRGRGIGFGNASRGDEDGRYARFADRIDLADADAEKRALGAIVELFSSDNEKVRLEAAKWWLAHRRRTEWTLPKEATEEPMTAEEADRLIADAVKLAKATGT